MTDKKLIAIVTSDIHLHDWKQFNINNRRLEFQLEFLKDLVEEANDLSVPIVFGGDLFHSAKHLTNNFLSYLPEIVKILSRLEKPFVAISGNHDMSHVNTLEKPSPSYITLLSKLCKKVIELKSSVYPLPCGDAHINLVGIPYLDSNLGLWDKVKELAKTFSSKPLKPILLLHTTLPGAEDNGDFKVGDLVENIPEDFKEYVSKTFSLVLIGHVHKSMSLGDNIIQIGSPYQLRVSDIDAQLGYQYLMNEGSRIYTTFSPIKYAPIFKYYSDESEINDDFNFWVKRTSNRVTITGLGGNNTVVSSKEAIAKYYIDNDINKVKQSLINRYLNDIDD